MTAQERSLNKQILAMSSDPPPDCFAGPVGDNLFHWKGFILGPLNTPYAGGTFLLDIIFPSAWPFLPLQVSFTTRTYHPYIDDNGSICCDFLQDEWSPVWTLSKILLAIQSLLSDFHDLDKVIRPDAAALYQNDPEEFARTAREWTLKYASGDSHFPSTSISTSSAVPPSSLITEPSDLVNLV